jgi:7-cyano-7-deazaguanine synthase
MVTQPKQTGNNTNEVNMRKAFVLLSGGMDSTTCLHKAILDYMPENPQMHLAYGDTRIWQDVIHDAKPGDVTIDWVEAFSVYYGQRHRKEMDYAKATCERLGIQHSVLDVGSLLRGDRVMLSDDSRDTVEVPNIDYADIKGVSPTYVPFRNGLLLSAITAQAQKWVNRQNEIYQNGFETDPITISEVGDKPEAGIYFGAHAEDAHNWAYPDCTPEFIGAMANAIYIGSYMQIRLHTPLEWLSKTEVVKLGEELGVNFGQTWSCYKGEEVHCGTCPTCRSRRQAFVSAKVEDPTVYASSGQ